MPVAPLSEADLPAATKQRLERGLPTEVRLVGWVGPTLFTSELSAGGFARASDVRGDLAGHAFEGAYVLGSVRETAGAPTAYALFVLQPGTGQLWLLDLEEPRSTRFVNTDVDAFFQSVDRFVEGWRGLGGASGEEHAERVAELRAALAAIDPPAFADDDRHWPTFFENALV
jgi:hypothetical protein